MGGWVGPQPLRGGDGERRRYLFGGVEYHDWGWRKGDQTPKNEKTHAALQTQYIRSLGVN